MGWGWITQGGGLWSDVITHYNLVSIGTAMVIYAYNVQSAVVGSGEFRCEFVNTNMVIKKMGFTPGGKKRESLIVTNKISSFKN